MIFRKKIDSHKYIRIALLGNQNNNHFALARYLRDHGFDCRLLLFGDEDEHFSPKADAYDLDYQDWVIQTNWNAGSFSPSASQIQEDVKDFDILIGCGWAPAFLQKAGIDLDVMIPYGWDIFQATFYKIVAPHKLAKRLSMVFYQRKGIRHTAVHHLTFNKKDDVYDARLRRLAPDARYWDSGVPMVYAPGYKKENLKKDLTKTHWSQEFIDIRNSVDFMLVAHGRHFWTGNTTLGKSNASKGNDILISGWALFCKRNPLLKKTLVFLEYGDSVRDSKRLISELGVENTIKWLPKMYRKDLMPGLIMADMVAAEFVYSWIAGGVIYEALVAGKPLLTYRDNNLNCGEPSKLYPIYNASTSEEIAERLDEYIQDPSRGVQNGKIGKKWYEDEVVAKALGKYTEYIESRAKALGKNAR